MGFRPTWALGSAGAISFFPLIDGVKRLVMLGEAGEANAKAIKICGTRWHGKAQRQVSVVMPNDGLSDMNDALIAERSDELDRVCQRVFVGSHPFGLRRGQ